MTRTKNIKRLPEDIKKPIEVANILKKVSVLSSGSQKVYDERIKALTEEQKKYIEKERLRKFKILAGHLNIDLESKDGWRKLAEVIAEQHFDGFKVRFHVTTGPKTKWDSFTLFRLYYEVYTKQKTSAHSIINICNRLVKIEPWKNLLVSSELNKAGESLNKQYRKAKMDPIVKAFIVMLESGNDDALNQVHNIYELICSGEIESLPK